MNEPLHIFPSARRVDSCLRERAKTVVKSFTPEEEVYLRALSGVARRLLSRGECQYRRSAVELAHCSIVITP